MITKDNRDLLVALDLIKEIMPVCWSLLLIGRDDGIGNFLKERAKLLGIDANVLWLGSRLDVHECLAAADIAVSASHEEGFSNSVLEAMKEGLPTVVTDVGGNPEAVENGVTGYVVPCRDPIALGDAILKLALDPKRAELGARGRSRVKERFSMDACINAYERLYFDLANERK